MCRLPADKRLSVACCNRRRRSTGCRYQRPRPPVQTTWYRPAADTIHAPEITEGIETLAHLLFREHTLLAPFKVADEFYNSRRRLGKCIGSCELRYWQAPLYWQLNWYRQTTSTSHSCDEELSAASGEPGEHKTAQRSLRETKQKTCK
jgi:hypothetical protein